MPDLEPTRQRPILYIECTHTYHSDVQSGIQRVVRNIMRNAGAVADSYGYDLVPVVFEAGQFREAGLAQVLHDKLLAGAGAALPPPSRLHRLRQANSPRALAVLVLRSIYWRGRTLIATLLPFPAVKRFLYADPMEFGLAWCVRRPLVLLRRLRGLSETRVAADFEIADPVALNDGFGASLDARPRQDGNILLLLDSSWHLQIWPAVRRFVASGGTTQTVVYDLIPITHPATVVRSLREVFYAWMDEHLRVSRRFMAISRSTAAELDDYLARHAATEADPAPWSITPFYLGSELDLIDPNQEVRQDVHAMFDGPEHVFIVVGSIEPRKNHRFILDAFDRHWRNGGTARLVIIGRHGWKTEDVMGRIEAHPQLGERLFLARDMGDSDLQYAYGHASALIIASEAEGFGLPVVEAFQRGLPVLCSDIGVFREIADGRATFFGLGNPAMLTDAVAAFCASHDAQDRAARHPQPWLTWRESTEQLLDVVLSPTPPPLTIRRAVTDLPVK
jgi:alpha-1,2-rhamnosyltransferase